MQKFVHEYRHFLTYPRDMRILLLTHCSEELLESLQGQLTSPQREEVKRRTDLWKQKHASGLQS